MRDEISILAVQSIHVMNYINAKPKSIQPIMMCIQKNIRIQSPFAARNFLHRSKAKSLEKGNEHARDGSLFAEFKHNAAIALFLLSNGSNNDSNDAPDVD